MSKFSEKYRSPFLTLGDFGDEPETFTIRDSTEELLSGDMKDVLYFEGKDKGWVVSSGNGKVLARLLPGIADTLDMVGGTITLHKQWFDMSGSNERRQGMKVIAATPPAGGVRPRPEPAKTALAEALDDEVPF